MLINPKVYVIDGLKIEWGKTFNEVAILLEWFDKFASYGGWSNLRCKCRNIYGLPSTEMNVRAPFADKPIMQVSYELSPIPKKFLQKIYSPYIKQLSKFLGASHYSTYKKPKLKNEFKSGEVVFSSTWLFDDIRISLSVYGGIRYNDSGPAAAGLFIDWIDEKKAAQPFRTEIKKIETTFAKIIEGECGPDIFSYNNTLLPAATLFRK